MYDQNVHYLEGSLNHFEVFSRSATSIFIQKCKYRTAHLGSLFFDRR